MEPSLTSGVEQVKEAVGSLRLRRPHYRPMLDYYEKVMVAQETVKAAMSRISLPDPFLLVDEVAEVTGAPTENTLINFAAGPARDLLATICQACRANGLHSPAMVERLEQAAADGGSTFDLFLRDFLLRDRDAIDRYTAVHGLDRGFLMHVVYNSLRPGLQIWSQNVATMQPEGVGMACGTCPVCSEAPALAILDDEGARMLNCHFCWHQWRVTRGCCPLCNNRDPDLLGYFYSEEEPEYRVELCESCRTYLKQVDSREAGRPLYPPLEHIVTLHLDLAIQKEGYTSSSDVPF